MDGLTHFCSSLGLGALLGCWLSFAGAAAAQRVVAVGDVHGEFDGLVAILREAGLIDKKNRWAGGVTTLVQTGDVLDRGPRVRPVMDLLMRLQDEAPGAGGRVVVLLGNHEALNLFADFADVAADAYPDFVDRKSKTRRKEAYSRWAEWVAQWPEATDVPGEEAWMAAHPLGKLEYREAVGPDGLYGRWLRGLPLAVEIGGTVFVHGGLAAELKTSSLEEINRSARREIEEFDRLRRRGIEEGILLPTQDRNQMAWALGRRFAALGLDPQVDTGAGWLSELFARLRIGGSFAFNYDSPVWFREFAAWSDEEGIAPISELLRAFGSERFVVGHSVRKRAIETRFGGRVYLIDTGMLGRVYGGRPSALEIDGDRVVAIYEKGEREVLSVPEIDATPGLIRQPHLPQERREPLL